MLKSMTAYAVAENNAHQGLAISVEIRTYNSRYLDLVLRLPPGFSMLEEKIKNLISNQLGRGRVEVRLTYTDISENACVFQVDQVKLKAFLACLEQLKTLAQIDTPASLEHLAGLPGIIMTADSIPSVQQHYPLIAECIQEALVRIDQMRCQEGAFIGQDIALRLDGIEARLAQIEAAGRELPAICRDKLQARIESLTEGMVELDPLRIAQEVAYIADRCDISEEIIRVRSHLDQFRTIMADKEPAGRRLNFLLQELNREFNTIGSKTSQASVAHMIVDIKAEIEKMREQVQNIE